jgi:hypothetical protein
MSEFGKLNLGDFEKGLIVAVLTAVLTVIYQSVSQGSLVFNWTAIASTGLTAAIAYVLKNLGTNSEGQFLTSEKKL